ncbi:MAG: putative membrane associated GTPase, Type A [Berkelbacteria bacterium GW2011_GWA2_46_7]|uniref:Putative membrane associated GTPase, Type A n=1 Tax=Berkelbacteria bacterium GW2011_GWA2_46_7 TaxID=1618335 RepID=A0A0G1QGS2_9BACT|nr:MAG: putative membrane associated GTPase, Type A [Berkelbacteria bacterium GW2011_GWA2_46_7]
MPIRNIAVIAHVDHGKTTLVDGLLKQSHTFRDNEAAMSQTLIMDSNDQERERGITILAKNTAVTYKGVKINIVDTPGHADFGGEVERTLQMTDGALLIIDAKEGPMPQTKFVLKKALELGLRPIVVINKIDKLFRASGADYAGAGGGYKSDAQIDKVLRDTSDLFLDLATDAAQLEFPVYYAVGREGKAWDVAPTVEQLSADTDLTPIFDAILKHIPAPSTISDQPFQMLVTALDWDNFQGKYAIGKVTRGDIVALTGLKNCRIGDTVADAVTPVALPTLQIAEPTLKMAISANTSPFVGQEGTQLTNQKIYERIIKELEVNVSLKMTPGDNNEYILWGRGELHLSVLIEALRREGFEMQIGKPQVVTKMIEGVLQEPVEELTVDVKSDYASSITGEIGKRKGIMKSQTENDDGTTRLMFEIPTRGLLGLRNLLLTLSRGTATMNSLFLRFEPVSGDIPKMRNGVLIASEGGRAVSYGLNNAQQRGITFINPQTSVYEGMVVGLHARDIDLEVNVTKEKKQTNVRAAGSDDAIALTPPNILSLEQSIDFLEDDELLEATPKSLRLRKRILNSSLRAKAKR